MGKLIQDITPGMYHQKRIDSNYITHVDTSLLVTELFNRGVGISDIFGMYYALEEMHNHHTDQVLGNDEDEEEGQHGGNRVLIVGDLELAGIATLPDKPLDRQPF